MYESQELLAQYLLFHFGTEDDQLPHRPGPVDALNYPARCISECLDLSKIPNSARALDLGCSVGRSSFELARHCQEVIGIDASQSFIEAAKDMKQDGEIGFAVHEEGPVYRALTVKCPEEIDRDRVSFEIGDACDLGNPLGMFDVILMANVIDRLRDPAACLMQLSGLTHPGAQLIITSPYTWLTDYTPEENWLCQEGDSSLAGLHRHLDQDFSLVRTRDLPFLLREHHRKYQWSVAQASIWQRR